MKSTMLLGLLISTSPLAEVVYVETTLDTDNDGKLDRMYVSYSRPASDKKVSTIYTISPYALGGTEVPMHIVDMDLLPQDEEVFNLFSPEVKRLFRPAFKSRNLVRTPNIDAPTYARVSAHSIGTGHSTGCPTVGDMAETLAAKSVIDWLNGRAKGFDAQGKEVKADWANGNVAMYGTSYDGTLPIMVAATGVEGLKAIVPIAAISNWYDYYRASGLVVNPGGYIGEDTDILGYFIVRKGACKSAIEELTKTQGRESGDFTKFWADRDHLSQAKNIKAATFIIHGQNDWNVKQKHAIQLWDALPENLPKRMFLHRGGHGSTSGHNLPRKMQAWLDFYLEGENSELANGAAVEVELPDGSLMVQKEWPHEDAKSDLLYFAPNSELALNAAAEEQLMITDTGMSTRLEALMVNPTQRHQGRLAFLTPAFEKSRVLSGTAKVTLDLAVLNRKAANITVAIVEYDKNGNGKIITRGWADPQNHADITQGVPLVPGKSYLLTFDLEPKQYKLNAGSKLGVLIASTDFEYTLRPKEGTQIQFNLGNKSFIELKLSP